MALDIFVNADYQTRRFLDSETRKEYLKAIEEALNKSKRSVIVSFDSSPSDISSYFYSSADYCLQQSGNPICRGGTVSKNYIPLFMQLLNEATQKDEEIVIHGAYAGTPRDNSAWLRYMAFQVAALILKPDLKRAYSLRADSGTEHDSCTMSLEFFCRDLEEKGTIRNLGIRYGNVAVAPERRGINPPTGIFTRINPFARNFPEGTIDFQLITDQTVLYERSNKKSIDYTADAKKPADANTPKRNETSISATFS